MQETRGFSPKSSLPERTIAKDAHEDLLAIYDWPPFGCRIWPVMLTYQTALEKLVAKARRRGQRNFPGLPGLWILRYPTFASSGLPLFGFLNDHHIFKGQHAGE
jgi:hypothetical protein